MSSHHEELQEIENAKYYWHNGGKQIFSVLLVAALLYLGYVIYQNRQAERADAAAALAARVENNGLEQLMQLQQNYADDIAAAQATLKVAAERFEAGKTDEAVNAYLWVLANQKAPLVQASAAHNLANVYLQQQKYDDALNILNATAVEEAYLPLFDETRGDIYAAQGKTSEAKQAYESALTALPEDSSARELLQLKVDML